MLDQADRDEAARQARQSEHWDRARRMARAQEYSDRARYAQQFREGARAWVRMSDGTHVNVPVSRPPGTGRSRPPVSLQRPVVRINLGGSSGNYNRSFDWRGPGRWVDTGVGGVQRFRPGQETAVPTTEDIRRAVNLARMVRQARFNRWGTWVDLVDIAVQIAMDLRAGWVPFGSPAYLRSLIDNPSGLSIINVCEGGDVTDRVCGAQKPPAPIPCTPTGIPGTFCRSDATTYWFFGKLGILPPYNVNSHRRPRFALGAVMETYTRPNGTTGTRPVPHIAPSIRPRAIPLTPVVRIPYGLAQHQPSNPRMDAPGDHRSNGTSTYPFPQRYMPPPGTRTGYAEPGPGVKEKKAKLPKWLAVAAEAAWESTELVDLIDALMKAMPEDVQNSIPKTGVTSPSAFRPGIPYSTPFDKARHLYRNWHRIDQSAAIMEVLKNEVEDQLWGRFFGGADAGWKRAGVNGYGVLF